MTASSKKKFLICAAITVFWFAMNAQLVRREVLLPSLPSARIGIGSTLAPGNYFKEQWMGIYYEGEKVGYSHTNVNKFSSSLAPGYIVRNTTYMVLSLLDTPVQVHFDGVLHTDENFKMRTFRSTIKSGDHKIRIDGKRDGGTLSLAVLSGSKVFRKEMKAGEDLNVSNSLTPLMFLPNLEPGVTYSLDILNPLTFTTSKAKITVTGMEPLEYMGKEVETYVIETEYEGLSFKAWVTESGDVLKEATPMGWTMLREDRKVAEDFRADAVKFRKDIARLIAVPTDVRIEDPENTRKSELFISGVDLSLFELDGAGQRLVNPETGLVIIEMRRPDPDAAMEIPIADDSLTEHLRATLLLQSDDRGIRDLAAHIAGDEKNSLIVAERINQWVFDNVNKKITFSLPSAVEVLETREGDCNEHTALYVALARACGIPSRIAVGLVYHKGSFYYHAWPEVYVGEWVAMDPTFGQSPADATHVRLLAGGFEEQVKLTQALGKISLKIKSFSYPPPEAEDPA
jgi:hypothetical protein